MPFMEDSWSPYMDDRQNSTDNELSTATSRFSPDSTTTDSLFVGNTHCTGSGHKRKSSAPRCQPRKKPRVEQDSNRPYSPQATLWTTTSLPWTPWRNDKGEGAPAIASPSECAGLPARTWQNVFKYLSPKSLGQLLLVNRAFHNYLTRPQAVSRSNTAAMEDSLEDSERIWTLARRRHHSHLPRPLHGYSELDMWRLIGGRKCQFCEQFPSPERLPVQSECHTDSCPSRRECQDVRICWPFAIRSCRKCLVKQTLTESELVATNLSFLIPCMTFVEGKGLSSSAGGNAVGTATVFGANCKRYLRSHVDWLRKWTSEISRESDSATAELWLNDCGVDARKRQRDAVRWEKWDTNGGRAKLFPKTAGSHGGQHCTSDSKHGHGNQRAQHRKLSPPMSGMSSPLPAPAPARHSPLPLSGTSGQQFCCEEQKSSFEAAQEAKSARVEEIIRRAAALNPPISFSVLRHMPAFQAAYNIPRQLEEPEWYQLHCRFQEQRADAETFAKAKAAEAPSIKEVSEEKHRLETETSSKHLSTPGSSTIATNMPPKVSVPNNWSDWEQFRDPIHKIISKHSRDLIASKPADQIRNLAPKARSALTIETFNHVYKKYMAEPTASQSFLVLRDMLWLLDHEPVLKPVASEFQCDDQECKKSARKFTFNGVLQHVASKHVKYISTGNSIMDIDNLSRALWPADLPFSCATSSSINGLQSAQPWPVTNKPAQEVAGNVTCYEPIEAEKKPEPSVDEAYQEKRDVFVDALYTVSQKIYTMKAIPACVKIFVSLCHAIENFKGRFNLEPGLNLIADAVTNAPSLRDLRATDVLNCRLCPLGDAPSASLSHVSFSIMLLVIHCEINHGDRIDALTTLARGDTLNWFKETIALPARWQIEPLLNSQKNMPPEVLRLYEAGLSHLPKSSNAWGNRILSIITSSSADAPATSNFNRGTNTDGVQRFWNHSSQAEDAPIPAVSSDPNIVDRLAEAEVRDGLPRGTLLKPQPAPAALAQEQHRPPRSAPQPNRGRCVSPVKDDSGDSAVKPDPDANFDRGLPRGNPMQMYAHQQVSATRRIVESRDQVVPGVERPVRIATLHEQDLVGEDIQGGSTMGSRIREPFVSSRNTHEEHVSTTRPRSRSRSPSNPHVRLRSAYRERDYQTHDRSSAYSYDYNHQIPAYVAPLRGGDSGHTYHRGARMYYENPPPPPQVVARTAPRVLYDEYGNEYVRTTPAPEQHPYVRYPPPPVRRGYL